MEAKGVKLTLLINLLWRYSRSRRVGNDGWYKFLCWRFSDAELKEIGKL